MKNNKLILSVALAGLAISTAPAAVADQSFRSGDWVALQDDTLCQAVSGLPGQSAFAIVMNPRIHSTWAEYRYLETGPDAVNFGSDDLFDWNVDGQALPLSEEVMAYNNPGEKGASIPDGFTGELVAALQQGQTLDIRLVDNYSGDPFTLTSFSLNGFYPAFAQAAIWCGFDPAALPTP